MSILLSLDSGGDIFSAALQYNGTTYLRKSGHGESHSAAALPMITALLADKKLTLADCDAFAFAAGPGKFSALRLVCALAAGFAYARNKPLIAVPSLVALATANATPSLTAIQCALPAQREHVYFAVCRRHADGWRQSSLSLRAVEKKPPAQPVDHACGAGFRCYPALLGQATLHSDAEYSDAAAVSKAALPMWHAGQTTPPLACEPIYVRDKIAQTIAERRRSNTS